MHSQESYSNLKITIVGTGLMGCSMAGGLRDIATEITGVDNNSSHLEEALARGLIDRCMSLEEAVADSGLILVTVPVDTSIELLPRILDHSGAHSVVIDAGSVKAAICRSIENHPARSRFIAAHPMAGLAVAGPVASDPRLFHDRKVVICEHEKSSSMAMDTASWIFEKLGMQIIYMDPGIHDEIAARISHLPQVTAYCLAALMAGSDDNGLLATRMASTGFESSTRLASSPAGIWIPIFQHNSEKISACLEEMIDLLSETRDMVKSNRWDLVARLIEKANKAREKFLNDWKKP